MIRPDLAPAFAGKRVLITGGLGFIGSNLARELVELGAAVTLVDSLVPEYGGLLYNVAGIEDRLTVNISDVRDEHSLRYLVRDQDVLFNLAGQTSHLDSMTDPYTDLEINARSQLSILEACRHENPGVTVVFASTRQIYGRPRHLPVDESHPIAPVDVNGINKPAGEWYHLLYGDVYGIRTTVLRLTNTYGPRMRVRDARQTFLGIWIRHALADEEILIFGDGSQRRDFTYVDDASPPSCSRRRATRPRAGSTTSAGTARLPARARRDADPGRRQRSLPPDPLPRRPEGDRHRRLLRRLLGDRARARLAARGRLEEGLARTLAYYREHGDAYGADE